MLVVTSQGSRRSNRGIAWTYYLKCAPCYHISHHMPPYNLVEPWLLGSIGISWIGVICCWRFNTLCWAMWRTSYLFNDPLTSLKSSKSVKCLCYLRRWISFVCLSLPYLSRSCIDKLFSDYCSAPRMRLNLTWPFIELSHLGDTQGVLMRIISSSTGGDHTIPLRGNCLVTRCGCMMRWGRGGGGLKWKISISNGGCLIVCYVEGQRGRRGVRGRGYIPTPPPRSTIARCPNLKSVLRLKLQPPPTSLSRMSLTRLYSCLKD